MIFQHDGAALRGRFVFKFLALLTRVKFQVDWCLKSGALVLPMIVALTAVLRTTVIYTVTCMVFLAANELLNSFISRGANHVPVPLHTGALSALATPLLKPVILTVN